MIIDDQLLQELLSRAKQLRRTEEISFNPMSEFVPYVSTKEIVHSKIICELLNPHGSHGCEDEFLKSFFEQFLPNLRFEDYSDFNVTLERKVTRVLTEGGVRSIDILVNFKDSCGKNHAIILENKLNHAEFQYLQIEDYIAGLVYEGIKVDHVVILHDRYQHCTASDNSISTTLLYPNQLSDWIKSVNNDNSGIDAYADYLMLLHNKNISYENSKDMLNLSLQEIKDLYKLKEAFENLTDAKNKYILEKVSAKLQPLSVEHTFSKLDEGCKLFQLWIQEDYKRNDLWVAIYPPENPADDEKGTDVYIYSHEERIRDASSIANKLGYAEVGTGDGYVYFKKSHNGSRFTFFDQQSREKMLQEIVRILKELHNV